MPWRVQAPDTPFPSMSLRSKDQALTYARQLTRSVKGVLKVQDLSGKFTSDRDFSPIPEIQREQRSRRF